MHNGRKPSGRMLISLLSLSRSAEAPNAVQRPTDQVLTGLSLESFYIGAHFPSLHKYLLK